MGPISCLCSMASRETRKFCDSGDLAKGQKMNRPYLGMRKMNPAAIFGGSIRLSRLPVTRLVRCSPNTEALRGDREGSPASKPPSVSWVHPYAYAKWLALKYLTLTEQDP